MSRRNRGSGTAAQAAPAATPTPPPVPEVADQTTSDEQVAAAAPARPADISGTPSEVDLGQAVTHVVQRRFVGAGHLRDIGECIVAEGDAWKHAERLVGMRFLQPAPRVLHPVSCPESTCERLFVDGAALDRHLDIHAKVSSAVS